MATYLDEIIARHRLMDRARPADVEELCREAAKCAPTRGFAKALEHGAKANGVAVIAEIKRRSPSKGDLAIGLDPVALAASYATGGASCLSVLTDSSYFGGSTEDLVAARSACTLPVLRKDFTVSPRDLYEARIMGADAVLLIVAALDENELGAFYRLGVDLGLDVLVEVHDERELDRALALGAFMIGVNQRDLQSFAVDPERAARVGERIPSGVLKVAESGIASADDVTRLCKAGFEAILVGEALVQSQDPGLMLQSLLAGAIENHGRMN